MSLNLNFEPCPPGLCYIKGEIPIRTPLLVIRVGVGVGGCGGVGGGGVGIEAPLSLSCCIYQAFLVHSHMPLNDHSWSNGNV